MYIYKIGLFFIVMLTNVPKRITGKCLGDELAKKNDTLIGDNKGNSYPVLTDEQCLNNLQFENNLKPSNHEFTTSIETRSLKNVYKMWVDTVPLVFLGRLFKTGKDTKSVDDKPKNTEYRNIRKSSKSKHKSHKHLYTNSSSNMEHNDVHIFHQTEKSGPKSKINLQLANEFEPAHAKIQSKSHIGTTPDEGTLYENAWEYHLVPLPVNNTDDAKNHNASSQPSTPITEASHSPQQVKIVDRTNEESISEKHHNSKSNSRVNIETKADDKIKCVTNSTSKEQADHFNNLVKGHDDNCRFRDNLETFHQQPQWVNAATKNQENCRLRNKPLSLHSPPPPQMSNIIKSGDMFRVANSKVSYHQQPQLNRSAKKTEENSNIVNNIQSPQKQECSLMKVVDSLTFKNNQDQSHQQFNPVNQVNLHIPQQQENVCMKIGEGLAFKNNPDQSHQQLHTVNEENLHISPKQDNSVSKIGGGLAFKSTLDKSHEPFYSGNEVHLQLPQQKEQSFTRINDGLTFKSNLDQSHQQFHPDNELNIRLPQEKDHSFTKLDDGSAFKINLDQSHQQFHPVNEVKNNMGSSILENNFAPFRLPLSQVGSALKIDGSCRLVNNERNCPTQSQLENSVRKTQDHSNFGPNFGSLNLPLQHENAVTNTDERQRYETNSANLLEQQQILNGARKIQASSGFQNHLQPQLQIKSERYTEDISGIGKNSDKYLPREQEKNNISTSKEDSNFEMKIIQDPRHEEAYIRNSSENIESKNSVSNAYQHQPLVNDARQIEDRPMFQNSNESRFTAPKLTSGTKFDTVPSFKDNETTYFKDKRISNEARETEHDFHYGNNLACLQTPPKTGSPVLKTDRPIHVGYVPDSYIPQQVPLMNTSVKNQEISTGYSKEKCWPQQGERTVENVDHYRLCNNVSYSQQPLHSIDATQATDKNSKFGNTLRSMTLSPQQENSYIKEVQASSVANRQLNCEQQKCTRKAETISFATNRKLENTAGKVDNSIVEVNRQLLSQPQFQSGSTISSFDTDHFSQYGCVKQDNTLKSIETVPFGENKNYEQSQSSTSFATPTEDNYYVELLKQSPIRKYNYKKTIQPKILLSSIQPFNQPNILAKGSEKVTVLQNYYEPRGKFVMEDKGEDISNIQNHVFKEQVPEIGGLVSKTPEVSRFEKNKYFFIQQPLEYKTNINTDTVKLNNNLNLYHQPLHQENNTRAMEGYVTYLNSPMIYLLPTQLTAIGSLTTNNWKLESNHDVMYQKRQPSRNGVKQFQISPADFNYSTPPQHEQMNTSGIRSVDSCTFESEYKFTQMINNSDSFFAPKDEIFRFENYSPHSLSQTKFGNVQATTELSFKCGNKNMFTQRCKFTKDCTSKADENINKPLDFKQQQVDVENSSANTYGSLKSEFISGIPKVSNELPHNALKTGKLGISLGDSSDYLLKNCDKQLNHEPNIRENINSFPQRKSMGDVCSYSDIHGVGKNSAIIQQKNDNVHYDKGVESSLKFTNNKELCRQTLQSPLETGGNELGDNYRSQINVFTQPYHQQNNVTNLKKTFGIVNNVTTLRQASELENNARRNNEILPVFKTHDTFNYPSQQQNERSGDTSKLTQQPSPTLKDIGESHETTVGLKTIEGPLLGRYNSSRIGQPIEELSKTREPYISADPNNQVFLKQTNNLQPIDQKKEDQHRLWDNIHTPNYSQPFSETNKTKTDYPWSNTNIKYTQDQNEAMNSNRKRVRNSGMRKKRLFFHHKQESNRNITEHP